jgi:hypothetical protein
MKSLQELARLWGMSEDEFDVLVRIVGIDELRKHAPASPAHVRFSTFTRLKSARPTPETREAYFRRVLPELFKK